MKWANLGYIFTCRNKCIKVGPICDAPNKFNIGSRWYNSDLADCMGLLHLFSLCGRWDGCVFWRSAKGTPWKGSECLWYTDSSWKLSILVSTCRRDLKWIDSRLIKAKKKKTHTQKQKTPPNHKIAFLALFSVIQIPCSIFMKTVWVNTCETLRTLPGHTVNAQ